MEISYSTTSLVIISISFFLNLLIEEIKRKGYYLQFKRKKKDRQKKTSFLNVRLTPKKIKLRLTISLNKKLPFERAGFLKLIITIILCLLALAAR